MPGDDRSVQRRRITSSYRLQFNRDFGFRQATDLIPYLDRLGITHLYASPIFAARPGSSHGYDVIDPTRLNPELGSAEAFNLLVETLHQHEMGLIIDIVPNHQATSELNPAWYSVLERGEQSPYASWFDIDWGRGNGKVAIPTLGRSLDSALNAGEISLEPASDAPMIRYFDHRFPLSPESRERFAAEIEGGSSGQELVRQLLDLQHYRLMDWRRASSQLNYRRFFNINDLIGVRVEDPSVFEATHQLIFSLVASGAIDGIRIDHVDGLADPTSYLQQMDARLQEIAGNQSINVVVEKILGRDEELNRSWPVAGTTGYDFLRAANDVFVDVPGFEQLKHRYDTVADAPGGFQPVALSAKHQIIERLFAGDLDALARDVQQIAQDWPGHHGIQLSAIAEVLAAVTCHLDVYRTYGRDGTMPPDDRGRIEQAIAPAEAEANIDPAALRIIRRVLTLDLTGAEQRETLYRCQQVVSRWQQFSSAVMAKSVEDTTFYRYCPLLSLNEVGSDPNVAADPIEAFHQWNRRAAEHWPTTMTTTSTHDTKRGEDARARLNVLSEIPAEWSEATTRWSALNQGSKQQIDDEPAPSTHDEQFIYQTLLAVWPSDARITDELRDRLHTYLTKTLREAKLRTSWLDPNQPYENAVHRFLTAILNPNQSPGFIEDFGRFARQASRFGAVNALAQLILKLTAVGVPDTYQGTEDWDLTLADPDNRRSVDFTARNRQLEFVSSMQDHAGAGPPICDLFENWEDGRIKLFLLNHLLTLRRERPALFLDGDYLPLAAQGPLARHVIAFARRLGDDWAITVVPRLLSTLTTSANLTIPQSIWADTALALPEHAPATWHGILDGSTIQVVKRDGGPLLELDAVFRHVPFAVLTAGS